MHDWHMPDELNSTTLASRRLAAAGGILMTMQSLSQRGGERVGILLANGFAAADIPVRIALLRDCGDAENELLALLHEDVFIASAGPPSRGPARKYLDRLRAVPFIRRQIRSFAPAVVLGTVNSLALATALSRGRTGARPAFALKLTNRLTAPDAGALKRIYRHKSFEFIFSRFDLVLTASEAERRSMTKLYPGRAQMFRTVPNPYVTTDMLSGALPLRSVPARILAAGRMVRQKRFDILLHAFPRLEDKTARLTILGDGPLRPDLQRLARLLGVADRLQMPGFAEDMLPWLRGSDLFVLSSDYEGLPAVVVEALACGVPVVATESFCSARELLGRLNCCAVTPTGNAALLAKAIDKSIKERAEVAALRRIARDYLIEPSISAHIRELGAIAVLEGRQASPLQS